MSAFFWLVGSLLALASVGAGAFGAHGLRGRVTPDLLVVFETAARYQMYHALALLAVAWLLSQAPSRAALVAGVLFLVGMIVFSGSLYLLVLTGARWWGAVTPIGGLAFLGGWLALAAAGWSVLGR
jgi:uncharacterized membrane protein YgdD (TMEM256/DUF423 family)